MSKCYKVSYSPIAKDDLRELTAYLIRELKAPQAARRILTKIRDEVRSLNSMPNRYALVEWEPWASMGMHKVSIGKFLAFYTVDESAGTVAVMRILYGGRDIEQLIQHEKE